MRKPMSLILATAVTLSAALLMGACNSSAKKTRADAADLPSATVAVVKRGNISHTLSLAGQFQPYQVVDVHPKVTGFMRKINVDIGDRVREGQVLAVLEVPELKAQLEGADSRCSRRRMRSSAPSMRSPGPRPSMQPHISIISGCSTHPRRSRAWSRNRNWTMPRAKTFPRRRRSMRPNRRLTQRTSTPRRRARTTTAFRRYRTTPA